MMHYRNAPEKKQMKGCSRSSKPHPGRSAIVEHFCCGNTPTMSYKTNKQKKTNSDLF